MPSDYMQKRKALRTKGLPAVIATVNVALGQFTEPEPGRTLGIDVSHWSGIVDFDKARDAGIKFAIIKYMDGVLPADYAEINYAGALHAGLLVGSYQWLRSELSEGRQAREYAAMLRNMPPDIVPAVDYEQSPRGKKYDPTIGNLYSIMAPLQDLLGLTPMVYTSPGFWGDHGSQAEVYKHCNLWLANYGRPSPVLPAPWLQWDIWQFTETGNGARYGVPRDGEKAVDLNYFRGSIDEMLLWCGKSLSDQRYNTLRS